MADVQVEMRQLDEQDKGRQSAVSEEQQPRMQHKTLLQQAKEKLVRSLPVFNSIDINDPKARGLALWIAAAHLALYLTVGLYFISTVTSREYGRKFLSPSADPGSVCEKIPVAVTGTYLADRSGMWETNSAFDAANPLYELTLTGTKVTEEQYTRVMQNFTAQLQAYGDRTASLDIIGSQIAWALFRASDADAVMRFASNAQLGQIFLTTRTTYASVFSSAAGVCQNPLLSRPSFDPSTLLLTVTVPDHAMPTSEAPTPQPSAEPSSATSPTLAHEFCPDQIFVKNYTFGLTDSPTHSFNVDLASAVTAFALNFGIIDTTSLTKTYSGTWNLGGDVGIVHEEYWAESNNPQMRSVRCYSKAGSPRVCFGSEVYTVFYPVLFTATRQPCQCPEDARNSDCNSNGQLRLALIFLKDNSYVSTIRAGWALQRMMQRGPDGPKSVVKLVAGLAYAAYYMNGDSQYDAWKRGDDIGINFIMTYNQFADGFKAMGPGVSIVSFELSYDGGNGASLNAQGVTLNNLATSFFNVSYGDGFNYTYGYTMCTDTIFQSQALQQMALAPPVGMVQPYLTRHPTLNSAFVTAAGIAAANSALVSSIFLVLAVFLTVQYFNTFSSDSSKKVVAPADKALRAAETEKKLLADNDKLFANDERLFAKYEAMSSELAAIKALLTRQQLQELSQQGYHAFLPPPVGFGVDDVYGENPLHRRSSGRGSFGPSARLSLTGVSAEEQASGYDDEQPRRPQQGAERRQSRFISGGIRTTNNPP